MLQTYFDICTPKTARYDDLLLHIFYIIRTFALGLAYGLPLKLLELLNS